MNIFWNVSKVCMRTYWSNWHPNLWSNLNFEKLLGRETPSCNFNKVRLKGGQNSLKRRESWKACLSIQYASKHMIMFQILSIWSKWRLHDAFLLGFGLKMAKIALNIVKLGMHSYFPNADLNLWLNFNFEKLVKRETSLCSITKVVLKGGENIL